VGEVELPAETRKETGTRSARRLRKRGRLPAVVYGRSMEPHSLELEASAVEEVLHKGTRLVRIKAENAEYDAVIQQVQYDHLNDQVLHVDFHRVSLKEKITIRVPVETRGEPKAAPGTGILERHLDELEIECVAAEVPDRIEVDVSGLNVGDVIHVHDLDVGEGIKILHEMDEVVVSMMAPAVEAEEEAEEAEEKVEEAEPELVQKRAKKEQEGAEE